jgi:hypothetical protein
MYICTFCEDNQNQHQNFCESLAHHRQFCVNSSTLSISSFLTISHHAHAHVHISTEGIIPLLIIDFLTLQNVSSHSQCQSVNLLYLYFNYCNNQPSFILLLIFSRTLLTLQCSVADNDGSIPGGHL